jgi:hypothetical protein
MVPSFHFVEPLNLWKLQQAAKLSLDVLKQAVDSS